MRAITDNQRQESMVMNELSTVFREVFQEENLDIEADMTSADIAEWDSIMHITLILSVEDYFGIRFRSSEVARLQSVGELHDLIVEKRAKSTEKRDGY
jgi:acyl carrier protein